MKSLIIDVGNNAVQVAFVQGEEVRIDWIEPHFYGAEPVTDDEIKDAVAEWRRAQREAAGSAHWAAKIDEARGK